MTSKTLVVEPHFRCSVNTDAQFSGTEQLNRRLSECAQWKLFANGTWQREPEAPIAGDESIPRTTLNILPSTAHDRSSFKMAAKGSKMGVYLKMLAT